MADLDLFAWAAPPKPVLSMPQPSVRTTRAREVRYRRLIKALHEASDALSTVTMHEPMEGSDSRVRLRRDIDEYAGYIESARWWRVGGGDE